jgi:hypothetical protein
MHPTERAHHAKLLEIKTPWEETWAEVVGHLGAKHRAGQSMNQIRKRRRITPGMITAVWPGIGGVWRPDRRCGGRPR